MGINKVQYGNTTLIDLTNDTVTADKLMQGYTAHDRSGAVITGTATGGGTGAISVVDTTDTNGGTIRTITAVDISDTTAVANDVAQGKYFYTADGTKTAGTSTGGGGGLEYEEGTWIPSEDIARPTISFTNSHTNPPMFYMFYDATETATGTESNTNFGVVFGSWYNAFGDWIHRLNDDKQYGAVRYIYSTTGNSVTLSILDSTSNAASTIYWATNSAITPSTGSQSRYWRAGRTYKWIAVWAPTT